MNAVFKHSQSKGAARLVLLSMADEANDEGLLTAYKRSHSHLASKANVDGSSVTRATKVLVDLGELEILHQGNGRASTDYRILLPGIEIEGVQDATPAPSGRHPRGSRMAPQGVQDATPIIPFSPGDAPVSPPTPVDEVFDAWLASTKRTGRTVLDSKRRSLITAALKTHPLEDVIDAVRGWENSPYHRGENPERKKWNDLGLLLRDAERIERFRDLARGPRLNGNSRGATNGYRPPPIDDDRSGSTRVLRAEDL